MSYRGKVISMDEKINLKEPKQILGLVLTDEMLLELLEKNENNPVSFISYDPSGKVKERKLVQVAEKIQYSCYFYIEIKNKSNLVMAEGPTRLLVIDCRIFRKQITQLQS